MKQRRRSANIFGKVRSRMPLLLVWAIIAASGFKNMAFNTLTFGVKTSDVIGFTNGQRTATELFATFSVVDKGGTVYANFKYPRFEYFFGYAQIMSGAFVVESIPLKYLNQQILHWRAIEWGINETIGCYFKAYGERDVPPVTIVPNTVKTRQPYTSIRFRLRDGVLANVGLTWETAEPFCGGSAQEPANEQGNPANPNNSTYTPGDRPSNQGGDPLDPSNNDGNYDPNDGNPHPPGEVPVTGTWKVIVSGINNACVRYQSTIDTLVGDPEAAITVSIQLITQNGACGFPDKRAVISSNGQVVNTAGTGGDLKYVGKFYGP